MTEIMTAEGKSIIFVIWFLMPICSIADRTVCFDFRAPTQADQYLKKYAGTYTIRVVGDNSGVDEMLELKSNGECTWSYQGQKKYGRWNATQGMIKTVIKGNSGDIPEGFKFTSGKFVSTDSSTRYLKKNS